jgi:hypothetical protein
MTNSCIICGAEAAYECSSATATLCRRHSQHMRIYQAMRRVMDEFERQERDAVLTENEGREAKGKGHD